MRNLANRLFGPNQEPAVLAGLATAYAGLLGQTETRQLTTQSFGYKFPDCHSPLQSFVKGWISAMNNPESLVCPPNYPESRVCAVAAAMYPWRIVLPTTKTTQEYFSACNEVLRRLNLEPITDEKTCYLLLTRQECRYPLNAQEAQRFWREFNLTFEKEVKAQFLQHIGRLLPCSSAALERLAIS